MPRSMPWPVTAFPPMRISPPVGLQKAGNDVEQRRLAAAGRPDDAEEFRLLDIEARGLHADHPAGRRVIDQRDVANLDMGHAVP